MAGSNRGQITAAYPSFPEATFGALERAVPCQAVARVLRVGRVVWAQWEGRRRPVVRGPDNHRVVELARAVRRVH